MKKMHIAFIITNVISNRKKLFFLLYNLTFSYLCLVYRKLPGIWRLVSMTYSSYVWILPSLLILCFYQNSNHKHWRSDVQLQSKGNFLWNHLYILELINNIHVTQQVEKNENKCSINLISALSGTCEKILLFIFFYTLGCLEVMKHVFC
jgi:energy-coupling factor transporter transmembrane protein EcfT